jgi:hypothetical protein
LVLGLGLWCVLQGWPDDRKAVRKHLEKAAHLVSLHQPESALTRLVVAGKLVQMCTSDAAFNLSTLGFGFGSIQGRDQLREAILASRALLSRLEIRLYDYQIEISPDHRQAQVRATAIADVNSDKNAAVQELLFQLNREPEGWRIADVRTVKALGR